MAPRQQVHRPVVAELPEDFGQRIEAFREASGLSVRSLARLLGVSPHRVREWRRGVTPASRYLFLLVTVAEAMGLQAILVHPDEDLPGGTVPEAAMGTAVRSNEYEPPRVAATRE